MECPVLISGRNGRTKKDSFLEDLARECGVSDRVHFVGSLAADQMPAFYDSLDIYVQPSKQEGLPRAAIEAMSRGCPVIGTDIAGIPELISINCLFKKNSDGEVVSALERIVSEDLIKIAETNFNKAREYEKDKLRIKRERFYDSFLSMYDSMCYYDDKDFHIYDAGVFRIQNVGCDLWQLF